MASVLMNDYLCRYEEDIFQLKLLKLLFTYGLEILPKIRIKAFGNSA